MTFQRIASLTAMAIAATATPALAQDRDSHFNGPYISGTFGIAPHSSDGGETLVFDTNQDGTFGDPVATSTGGNAFLPGFCNGAAVGTLPADGCSRDRDDIEYSGRLGYDMRMGNWVAGALFEVSKSESTDGVSAFSNGPDSYALTRSLDHALSLRLRGGYTPGGGALFYVTGGASYAKIDHDFATSNTTNAFTQVDNGKRVWGWQAGGGSEIMLTDNISLGVEYLYSRYDDDKYHVLATAGTAPATSPFVLASNGTSIRPSDTRYDFHSLRGTLSWQF